MRAIQGDAIVSCYIDVAAMLLMLILLALAGRFRTQKSRSLQVFFRLCLSVEVLAVTCLIFHVMRGQPAPWCHTAALISKTVWECLIPVICSLWIAYIYTRLISNQKQILKLFRLFMIPLAICEILFILNLFTGIIFTIGPDNQAEPGPLFYLMVAVEFLYFLATALLVQYYDRKFSKVRFLHVTPMMLSVGCAVLTQYFLPYDLGVMGFAVAMALLYLSIINETLFIDFASGLFNSRYMAFLFDLSAAGKSDVRSALILEMDGYLPAGFKLLRDTLHHEGDVIRLDDRKLVMFSRESNRSTLQYITSLMEEALEKHNAEHPEEKVRIAARLRMRTESEDAFTFLRAVIEDREAGDEVRGIVSMISELDRLDKELALAADIQLNSLPMNFPPFPEHTEFDLFASMTPAKEVGGDFYDFFLVDNDHLAMVIADVSGKGIPAALFMMVSKTLIKNQLMTGCDPAAALERVNLQLCERNSSRMFVTVWLAVLEISTGKGLAVNAGHENPGLRRAGGDFELLKYKHNMFIGVSKKAKYQNREFELAPGDSVFVYTDGVPEATTASGEMFGEERLTETLNRNPDAEPEELIRRVHGAVDAFAGGAPQFDDITMLCLKYHGNQNLKEDT